MDMMPDITKPKAAPVESAAEYILEWTLVSMESSLNA